MFRVTATLAALALGLSVAGCQTTESTDTMPDTASLGIVNSTCPMMGMDVDESSPTTTYKGATIAFCCERCIGTWNGKSADEKDAMLAAMRK